MKRITLISLLIIFFSCKNEKVETLNSGITKENWSQIRLISDTKAIYILRNKDSAIYEPSKYKYVQCTDSNYKILIDDKESEKKKIFISKQERDSIFDWCSVYLKDPPLIDDRVVCADCRRDESIYIWIWGSTRLWFTYETEKASEKLRKNFNRIKALTFDRVK